MEIEDVFASILKDHIRKVRKPLTKLPLFFDQYLDDGQVERLAGLGREKLLLSLEDGKEHSIAMSIPPVFYHITTIPVSLAEVSAWFIQNYGGYMKMVYAAFTSLYQDAGCDFYCNILYFYSDKKVWVNLCVIPEDKSFETLIPRAVLSPEEIEQIGL